MTATAQYTDLDSYKTLSKQLSKIVLNNGKPVEHTIRMPHDTQLVVIDALNTVIDAGTFDKKLYETLRNSDFDEKRKFQAAEGVANQIAFTLGMLFGHEYSEIQYTNKGANFYDYAWRIGDPKEPLGLICIGQKKTDTVLIMFYGAGCHYMPNSWEGIWYGYLTHMTENPKITRVDLALDDFEGVYSSAELADLADTEGKFALTNKVPGVQHLGDWKRHTGKGRTLQVGTREGGKLYRGYEKGKQLGDSESFWFRHEIELSNKNRYIPLDVLIDPTGVFKGCYPYCAELLALADNSLSVDEIRIETISRKAKISYDRSKQILKTQFGKYLKVFRDFQDDSEILDELVSDVQDYYPKRLAVVERLRFETPIIFKRHWDTQNQPNEILLDIPFDDGYVTLNHIPKSGKTANRQAVQKVPF